MFDKLENPWILIMFLGLFGWLLAAFFYQRWIGKKQRAYDERYHYQVNRMKARSWDTMVVVMLIAMPVVIILDGVSFSYFFLMVLFFLHILSMGISAIFYYVKDES